MGRYLGPADFEGMPIASLRNLPTDFFTPQELYFNEDETSLRPTPGAVRLDTNFDQTVGRSGLELSYSSETAELGNKDLPVFAYRHEIARAVTENPITIIVAETGAGKSTQVPQFLLDEGYSNVYLTQPRRAAARNVFERIRSEVGLVRGEHEAGSLISYRTAGERDGPDTAPVKVVTDGLHLMRELHNSGINERDVLIIDEVHEWNSNIEGMIAWVKKSIAQNPNLRVVVMSATMDAQGLANYFGEVCEEVPPIIEVPGRTFAVERREEPGSTVVEQALGCAKKLYDARLGDDEPNGILIFEPGKREINDAIDEIRRGLPPEIAKVATILPLHAKLSVAEQQAAFRKYKGLKIVVATDVAQTSLTIPDIKYVIDSGLQRRMELDKEGAQGLVLNPISQADCNQRAGRAGRVSDGVYILTRLDTKADFVNHEGREKYPMAEILRTDLVRNTLKFAAADINIALLDFYHPLSHEAVEQAQATLRAMGALDIDNSITELGKRMNEFPVCVTSARMMVEVGRYSEQTRAYMAAIVASKEAGGLPYFAYNVGKRWKGLTEETTSDMLAQLDIFIATQSMSEKEMKDGYDLDTHNVVRAREQYRKIATKVRALQDTLPPPTPEEREDLKRCIITGLANSIYVHQGAGNYVQPGKSDNPRQISNRSVVHGRPAVIVGDKYRVEKFAGGLRVEQHILEHATAATLAELGRVAVGQTEWRSEGFAMRGGRFVDVRRLHLFGIDLGATEEIVAEPSPKLREAVIAHVLENAGTQQTRLRDIKRQLEELAHLAKDPVRKLTHDDIVRLVLEAAPEDITDPSIIENNLRLIIDRRNISLDSYISAERRARIVADAPGVIEAEGVTLGVAYQSTRPLVRHYIRREVAKLRDEVFLHDGRQVYFVHEGKKCTLVELQEKLGIVRSYI